MKCHSLEIRGFTAKSKASNTKSSEGLGSHIGHRVTDSGFWNEEEGRMVVLVSDISHTTSAESSLSEYKPNF